MLEKILRKLIEFLNIFLYPLTKVYFSIFKPTLKGVCCLIIIEEKIILVRHSYGFKLWTLPGGGLKKDETFEEAIEREMREELNIETKRRKRLGKYKGSWKSASRDLVCFLIEPEEHPEINSFEIKELGLFSLDDLPPERSEFVDLILKKYRDCLNF